MTQDQHRIVYLALDAEVTKARKASVKARKDFNNVTYNYGGSVESEKTAVMLNLRLAQYKAAVKIASEYFDSNLSQ